MCVYVLDNLLGHTAKLSQLKQGLYPYLWRTIFNIDLEKAIQTSSTLRQLLRGVRWQDKVVIIANFCGLGEVPVCFSAVCHNPHPYDTNTKSRLHQYYNLTEAGRSQAQGQSSVHREISSSIPLRRVINKGSPHVKKQRKSKSMCQHLAFKSLEFVFPTLTYTCQL